MITRSRRLVVLGPLLLMLMLFLSSAVPTASADTPLSVWVSGPVSIGSSRNYTWTAHAGGGNGVYTYFWERDYYDNDTWSDIDDSTTSATQTITCFDNPYGVNIRVTVTSGTQQVTAYKYTAVNISGPCD